MRRLTITESDRNQILSKHTNQIPKDLNDVVVTDWLSPDEKYVIFLDELYDLENKTKLGDIWKSPDNLILFLEHSFRVSKLRRDIKEHASEILNKKLLSESVNDLTDMKSLVKEFLMTEDFWNDTWVGKGLGYAGKFIKDTAVDTVKGVGNFVKDFGKGTYNTVSAAMRGDWGEVWNLMKQGTKWLARKIRQAVYSPVGIIIDTILIATEIGKIPQAVVWAIVVSLDIYEFVTGDYEHKDEPMWLRIVFFLIDILGLVTAGIAAKGARSAVAGFRELGAFERSVAKSSTLKEILTKCLQGLKNLPSELSKIGSMLSKGYFGKLFKMALDNAGKFVKWILENLKSSWKSPALKSVLINSGLVVGIGAGTEYLKDRTKEKEKIAKIEQEKEEKAYEEIGLALADNEVDMSPLLKV